MHTCIDAYMHHIYIYTYIHTHTLMNTCIHTYAYITCIHPPTNIQI